MNVKSVSDKNLVAKLCNIIFNYGLDNMFRASEWKNLEEYKEILARLKDKS